MPAAVNLLARSIALLPDDHPARGEALSELGSTLMRTGDFTRADEVLTQALELAAAAGDKKLELRTLIEREFFRTFTNPTSSTEELVRIAEGAIPLLDELGDDFGLAKAWWLRSEADVNAGRWGARASSLERALEHAQRAGDARDQATIIGHLAQALAWGPTPVPEAIRRCEELRALAPDQRAVGAAVDFTLAPLHAMEGRFDEARELCVRAQARCDELGLRYMRAVRSFDPAYVELLADNVPAAVDELHAAYDALERMGERGVRSTIAAFLARALVADRRYAEAEMFTEISEEAGAVIDVVTQAVWRCGRARCRAHAGDTAQGEVFAREAVDLAAGTDFLDLQATTLLDLAEVLRLAGRGGDVPPLVEAARERYERKGNVVLTERAAAILAAAVR
jgi:tetratricopeptide (TPR) repeat protein